MKLKLKIMMKEAEMIDMAKSKNKSNNMKGKISVLWTTLIFTIIAIALLIIGYHNQIVHWMMTMGIVILMIAVPIAVTIVYLIVKRKIEEM